ncbi:hypothetical protein Patl1_26898 [Pistacia atlantica]|uniref:Uncharacterized protein n=1 Tax=Pistacia atlantica TaxID=434234 RepID=A0ACC1B0L2_9ROSI|nr:hypothetical protein Patl1_26898 [Pistacia atlantica]
MEISEQNVKGEAHILCYSFAVQGHLNPILQFCKRLASKGLKVTLVSTISASSKLIKTQSCSPVDVELLDVDLKDIPNTSKECERDETQDYFEHYKTVVAPSLAAFIENQMGSNYPPKFLVYDSIIPWALDITKRFGIDGAPFFTQSWSCNTMYYQYYREKSKVNAFEDQAMVLLPSLPPLKINELPSFLNGSGTYPSLIDLIRIKSFEKFLDETSEKGLVVRWCSRLSSSSRVVGCFMTHCGWNSTLEAVSVGVPMVAMPQWTDQPTNAKFIEDMWGVGMRARGNGEGIVKREEIEVCIREVMEGERGKEIKRNSKKWKDLAKEAVDEGGSTDKNIQEFVAKVLYV